MGVTLASSQGCCSINACVSVCVCVFLVTLNCSFLLRRLTLTNSHLRLQLWRKNSAGADMVKQWFGFVCVCGFGLIIFIFYFL